jgi:cardiolipin synthase
MQTIIHFFHSLSIPESIGLGSFIHVVLTFSVILHVLNKPRDARTSLLWISGVMAFPFIGPIIYVLFGINTIPRKAFKKLASDRTFFASWTGGQFGREEEVAPVFHRSQFQVHLPGTSVAGQLSHLLAHYAPDFPLLSGNDVRIFERAETALDEMIEAMRQAKEHIHLSTFIFNDDVVGSRVMEVLAERARAGVHVRVLYDTFGSALPSLRFFFWRYRRVPNLHLVGFSQANVFKRKFQFSLRNHRKITVIDGKVAFTGGLNFHDVYLSDGRRPGVIDYHFRVQGPVVSELQYTFLRDWFYMTEDTAESLLCAKHFPRHERAGEMVACLQNSSPTSDEMHASLNAFFAASNMAQKQILIVTPYLVPPAALVLALQQAAFRGVDVKILVPAVNNHPTIRYASQALYTRLLMAGVRIFERRAPFIHAKAMVIDGEVAFVGSANMDSRSLILNYETNLAVFDTTFVERLRLVMQDDFDQADEMDYAQWRLRSKTRRLIENFFNLFHLIA